MTKKTRLLSMVLAIVLLFSGCAGNAAPVTEPESRTSAGSVTEKQTEAPVPETSSAQAATEASAGQSSQTENTGDPTESAGSGEEAQAVSVEEDFFPLGLDDVAELPDLDDHGLASEPEEMDRIARVMRDYKHPSDSLLVNDAPYFYYYEQLSSEQKKLYDVLMMAAEDPSGSNYVAYLTKDYPGDPDFTKNVNVVFYSMLYDHPELFWLYYSQRIFWKYVSTPSLNAYTVYFYVEEYPEFEDQVMAFNEAADEFLSDISRKGSQLDVARRIHDKLIRLVDYDYDLADRNTRFDLGHTAYGSLVANSAGAANNAVCDGYSLAFNYLLQQAGIPAAFMIGYAGSTPESAGCHAWSLMNCDGKWMEADATWDDFGNTLIRLDRENSKWLKYWKEIFKNKKSCELKEHYLFGISTKKIRNYKAPKKTYESKDGKWIFTLLSDSVHIRDCELHSGTTRATIFALAPTAP